MTIKEAVKKATQLALKRGVPESQAFMVGCLAVRDEMAPTLENLKALRDVMRENNPLTTEALNN